MTITGYLFHGRDRAVKIGELSESLKVPRRVIEESIQAARLDGIPIVSGSEGVWLGTDAEALAWCERQRSRAIHLIESAQGVKAGVERRGAPLTLWEAA